MERNGHSSVVTSAAPIQTLSSPHEVFSGILQSVVFPFSFSSSGHHWFSFRALPFLEFHGHGIKTIWGPLYLTSLTKPNTLKNHPLCYSFPSATGCSLLGVHSLFHPQVDDAWPFFQFGVIMNKVPVDTLMRLFIVISLRLKSLECSCWLTVYETGKLLSRQVAVCIFVSNV